MRQQTDGYIDPERVSDATEELIDRKPTSPPPVWAVRVLLNAFGSPPWDFGRRQIRNVKIENGQPQHGELRSDDHVSDYELEFPIREWEEGHAMECPECGEQRAVYEYNAYHYISVRWSIVCTTCGHMYEEHESS